MKLRQPNADPPPCDFSTESGPGIWQEFEVTTLTPIYGGGVKAGEPDPLMPVRAAAIRGQLRFWWRLLKRYRDPENPLPWDELFKAEREIWGGMAEKNQDYASKVRVRVNNLKGNTRPIPYRDFMSRRGNRDIGYVLFPAQDNQSAKVIEEGFSFKLTVECHDKYQHEVFEALRWWASFGGIGSRTRRGLGAVQVKGLPPVIEVDSYGCKLVIRDDLAMPASADAWHQAIKFMRDFRQGEKGRNKANQNPPGRSHWPEPESIRAMTGRYRIKADGTSFAPKDKNQRFFPRAIFGLPIIFHFKNITQDNYEKRVKKDQQFDPHDCTLKPKGYDRMASPLILRPMALPDGNFAPIALQLPIKHVFDDLPGDHLSSLPLELRGSGNRAHNPGLPQDLSAGTWWPIEAVGQPLLNYQGQDALTAFLNYFARG